VTNLMQVGDALETVADKNDGAVKKGFLIRRGNLVGIALNAAKPGDPLRLAVGGVWTLAKIAKTTAVERAYWAGQRWAARLAGKDVPAFSPAFSVGARVYGRADLGVKSPVRVSGRVTFGSRS